MGQNKLVLLFIFSEPPVPPHSISSEELLSLAPTPDIFAQRSVLKQRAGLGSRGNSGFSGTANYFIHIKIMHLTKATKCFSPHLTTENKSQA